MKTLNLVNLNKSDIKYKISKFPDGQQQIKILSNIRELLPGIYLSNFVDIQIKTRLNNFQDLELLICTVKSLKGLEQVGLTFKIHLYTPYFLGSRSDRKFEEGSNNYLKDVICPIINSLNFDSVTVLDPHSHVLEACLNNFKKESNEKLVRYSLKSLYLKDNLNPSIALADIMDLDLISFKDVSNNFILVSPDAGASKKIYKLAEQIGYKGDIITCNKDRDAEGKLTRVVVPDENGSLGEGKDVIIIDDICDGGATFINIAKQFKANGWKNKIYLIVTHGIFSKGFKELSKYFDGIYCTNSYGNVINTLQVRQFVKQLNVY